MYDSQLTFPNFPRPVKSLTSLGNFYESWVSKYLGITYGYKRVITDGKRRRKFEPDLESRCSEKVIVEVKARRKGFGVNTEQLAGNMLHTLQNQSKVMYCFIEHDVEDPANAYESEQELFQALANKTTRCTIIPLSIMVGFYDHAITLNKLSSVYDHTQNSDSTTYIYTKAMRGLYVQPNEVLSALQLGNNSYTIQNQESPHITNYGFLVNPVQTTYIREQNINTGSWEKTASWILELRDERKERMRKEE